MAYYKKFSLLLTPLLTDALNYLFSGRSFHTESLMASISIIPKPNTDDTAWSNYRPISILNLDIKILAKVLSTHLNPIIGTLIHKDQSRFIPSHQAGDNIRRATLLAHLARTRCIPTCFISLDIRKAFDTLSWPYLHSILHRWGFDTHFLHWISALYQNPRAYVTYSGFGSDYISIEQGTRQGCPLSPILFTVAIKPLALLIRSNPNIHGLELNSHHHKLCLFADDVLLFLTSPLISAPNLLHTLYKFGGVSGLQVKPQKSTTLNISLSPSLVDCLTERLPFPWATSYIPYLGVKFTANPEDLFATTSLCYQTSPNFCPTGHPYH